MDVIVSPLCPIMFHDRYFLLDKWWNSWHGIPGLQPSGLSLLFLPIPHYWVLTGPALSFLLCVFSLAASSDRTYYPHPYSLYKSNPKPPRLQSLPRPSPSGMNLCFPHTPFLLITISTAHVRRSALLQEWVFLGVRNWVLLITRPLKRLAITVVWDWQARNTLTLVSVLHLKNEIGYCLVSKLWDLGHGSMDIQLCGCIAA